MAIEPTTDGRDYVGALRRFCRAYDLPTTGNRSALEERIGAFLDARRKLYPSRDAARIARLGNLSR
jgi:hypothetical protein